MLTMYKTNEKYNSCQFEEQYVINVTLKINPLLKGLKYFVTSCIKLQSEGSRDLYSGLMES